MDTPKRSPATPHPRDLSREGLEREGGDGGDSSGDAMIAEMAAQAAAARPPAGARPPKIRYSHQAMADLIIANPGIAQNQLAAIFGYTPAWVSTVVNSDAFQALLASRRSELVDPEIAITLNERFHAMTTQSLKVLQDKLARPADQVSDQLALRAAELGAKALGIGGNAPPPAPADPSTYLPQLAERLMKLQGRTAPPDIEDARLVQS